MLSDSKSRAKLRGLEHNIGLDDIMIPEKCPVLGIRLWRMKGERTNHTPSLDRIDSSKGYIKGNIVVVSWRANLLKRDATSKEIRRLADFYCEPEEDLLPPEEIADFYSQLDKDPLSSSEISDSYF